MVQHRKGLEAAKVDETLEVRAESPRKPGVIQIVTLARA